MRNQRQQNGFAGEFGGRGSRSLKTGGDSTPCFEIELENNYLPDKFYDSTHLKDTDAQAVLLAEKDDNPELSIAWAIIAPRPPHNIFRIGWLQTAHKFKGHGHGGFLGRL